MCFFSSLSARIIFFLLWGVYKKKKVSSCKKITRLTTYTGKMGPGPGRVARSGALHGVPPVGRGAKSWGAVRGWIGVQHGAGFKVKGSNKC